MKFTRPEIKILRDNKSGSSEILASVIKYYLELIKRQSFNPDSINYFKHFNGEIRKRFAPMAIVVNGIGQIDQILSDFAGGKKSRRGIIASFNRFIKEIRAMDRKIITNCRDLFRKKISVATYSNSGLVKKIIKHYQSKVKKVFLSESRPAGEGKDIAEYFARENIDVTFSVDMFLPELIKEADLLILGADSVGGSNFINKIGSTTILKAARSFGLKNAVLFESLKIVPGSVSKVLDNQYNRREIWPGRISSKIEIINRYFEMVPNRLIDIFISDSGIDSAVSLKKRI